MSIMRLFTALAMLATASMACSACAPSATTRSAQDPPAGESAPQQTPAGPELWIHGIANPERLTSVSAKGVRLILNASKELSAQGTRRRIAQLDSDGLGIVITIRLQDPNARKKPVRLDAAPTEDEAREISDNLLAVLNSPESRQMAGRIWVQFFNEVAGGPGTIMPEQADGLYEFATRTAERIRREAPHVKIIGPALTALDPLDSAPAEGSKADLRRQGLLRAIQWSIASADAVDIHLHSSGGDDARQQLEQLRQALKQEGHPDFPIVSLEWSPARFPARSADPAGAAQAMTDIYQAMADAGVVIAAYAAFADTALKDTYEWAYLWEADGRPHEPYFSRFRSLSRPGGPGEGDDQDRQPAGEPPHDPGK